VEIERTGRGEHRTPTAERIFGTSQSSGTNRPTLPLRTGPSPLGLAAHFAVNYLAAGGDIHRLSELLGHASYRITYDVYAVRIAYDDDLLHPSTPVAATWRARRAPGRRCIYDRMDSDSYGVYSPADLQF
jgi:hypothetical protein